MQKITNILDILLKNILIILMVALVAAVSWQVISRYGFSTPSSWTEEALAAVEAAGVIVTRPDKQPFMEAVEEMKAAYDGTEVGRYLRAIEAVE